MNLVLSIECKYSWRIAIVKAYTLGRSTLNSKFIIKIIKHHLQLSAQSQELLLYHESNDFTSHSSGVPEYIIRRCNEFLKKNNSEMKVVFIYKAMNSNEESHSFELPY